VGGIVIWPLGHDLTVVLSGCTMVALLFVAIASVARAFDSI
jgi:hypothetical protein